MKKIQNSYFVFGLVLLFNWVSKAEVVPTVDTLILEKQKIQRLVKYPALIKPVISAKLTSEINGTVTRIARGLGSKVKKGEVVFYLKNNQLGMNFNEYAVRSPVTGIVAKLDVNLGKLITIGESVGEVLDPVQFKLVAQAPAADAHKLKIGYKAIFELQTNTIASQISALSPVVNPQTGTIEMELSPTHKVDQPIMGAIGRLTVYLPTEEHLLLPPEALIKLNLKKFVRKIASENKIAMTEVEVGDLVNGQQIITRGLREKDEVVLKSSEFVKDGDKVERQAKTTNAPGPTQSVTK